jgi:diphosphomevalonate decarboxylase
MKATAVACANIAFVKYWGHAEAKKRLPANPSISLNLDCLSTTTTVALDKEAGQDTLIINGTPAGPTARERVSRHLDRLRALAGTKGCMRVVSRNSFPTGAGLASSASAFAALTVAAAAALDLSLDERTLQSIARLGSGSACRSIPSGFVEWTVEAGGGDSYAHSIAPPDHWGLCDCIAVVSAEHKHVGSIQGHEAAPTSLLHRARVEQAPARVEICRQAILDRDLATLGREMEEDAVAMHAVAMTARPPVYYWMPDTLRVVRAVVEWRAEGLPVYYTIDAGPNVHCLCEQGHREIVEQRLRALSGVAQVLVACPGREAHLVPDHLD